MELLGHENVNQLLNVPYLDLASYITGCTFRWYASDDSNVKETRKKL